MTKRRTSDWMRGNALSLVAIFIALTGGTAYATHPGGQNTISSADIIDDQIRGVDIRTNNVREDDIGGNAVISRHIKGGAVQSSDVRDDTVNNGGLNAQDLNPDSVGSSELASAAVTLPKLAFDPATQTELNAHKSSGDHDERYWALAGNKIDGREEFLGTTNDVPLDLKVNNARALRLEPASDGTNESPNVIGGIADNFVTAGAHSATIGGGGRGAATNPATANRVTDDGGTISGGLDNQAGDDAGTTADREVPTVGGGRRNTASGPRTTVGGGFLNTASVSDATVGGGSANIAAGEDATVAGGQQNEALDGAATVGGGLINVASAGGSTIGGGVLNAVSGNNATVPGGTSNTAAGALSFAAGRRAKANHLGTFVWGDSQNADIASADDDQFIARAAGGFFLQDDSTLDFQGGFLNTSTGAFLSTGGAWTNASDENAKTGFEEIEPDEVLAKVAELPVREWRYEAEPGVRHLGPTAQDFRAAFGLGSDQRHIASVDADGVALAAIKGLERELRAERRYGAERDRRIARLETALARRAKKSG